MCWAAALGQPSCDPVEADGDRVQAGRRMVTASDERLPAAEQAALVSNLTTAWGDNNIMAVVILRGYHPAKLTSSYVNMMGLHLLGC